MPTYDYECYNGHRFDAFQSMTEAPLDRCPICEKGQHTKPGSNIVEVRRIIGTGAGVIWKGGPPTRRFGK
jgi:putative FmdB family regulatory protein